MTIFYMSIYLCFFFSFAVDETHTLSTSRGKCLESVNRRKNLCFDLISSFVFRLFSLMCRRVQINFSFFAVAQRDGFAIW